MTQARIVRLGDICRQDRSTIKPGEREDLRYVGLESIESGTGRIQHGELSKTPHAPLGGSFRFDGGHVLYGKLRPYLNKVALPDAEGKCSTEIVPLRPADDVDRRYLAYFLRAPQTAGRIAKKSSGARMPRADMDYVLGLRLRLPQLDEQRRIVELLSCAEGIVRLQREARGKAAQLNPALFIELFGDPTVNPKQWPRATLGELLRSGPQNGLYKHRSSYGSGTPILRIDAFYDGEMRDMTQLKRLRLEPHEAERFALARDDIVINRVNSLEYLGKSALVPALDETTVFESNLMRLVLDTGLVAPRYLIALLQTPQAKQHFRAHAKHAINQASINQQDVRSLPVMLPPLPVQLAFGRYADAAASIVAKQAAAQRAAEMNFDALLAEMIGREDSGEK